jgi:hypothetical protein
MGNAAKIVAFLRDILIAPQPARCCAMDGIHWANFQ